MAKKSIKKKTGSKINNKKAENNAQVIESKNPKTNQKSFAKTLKSIFFPSKEEYTPQKQLKEIQWGLYFLAVANLLLAIAVSPYIIVDSIILFLIGFNLGKQRQRYVAWMLILYTASTILINYLAKQPPFNLVNIVLIIFCIQTSRLVLFKKK